VPVPIRTQAVACRPPAATAHHSFSQDVWFVADGSTGIARLPLSRGCLKCEADRLAIVFEQEAGKNAFSQGADVQPFVRGVLETTVVQVVPADVDARP
jgi:hypothetical protein